MKLRRTLTVCLAITCLLGAGGSALSAESPTKSKSKGKAASEETGKTETKKSESKKSAGKKGGSTAAKEDAKPETAELKRANTIVDELTTARKAALTKLLNGGSKKELMTLPGIGDTIADAIIKARPLESAAHLITVEGVGEKTLAEIVKSRK